MWGALKQNLSFSIRTLIEEQRLYCDCSVDTGVGDRRDDCDLQRRPCGVRTHALSKARSTCHGVVQGARRQKLGVGGRFSGVAATQHVISGHGRMERRLV